MNAAFDADLTAVISSWLHARGWNVGVDLLTVYLYGGNGVLCHCRRVLDTDKYRVWAGGTASADVYLSGPTFLEDLEQAIRDMVSATALENKRVEAHARAAARLPYLNWAFS